MSLYGDTRVGGDDDGDVAYGVLYFSADHAACPAKFAVTPP